ncbi:hypothetical protein [Ehrlichia minasensis]|nr:hypothetical protein [Ehrlichia minasensis]
MSCEILMVQRNVRPSTKKVIRNNVLGIVNAISDIVESKNIQK